MKTSLTFQFVVFSLLWYLIFMLLDLLVHLITLIQIIIISANHILNFRKMKWELLTFCKTKGDEKVFYKSMQIWLKRPNVCNRIVSCCTLEAINLATSFEKEAQDQTKIPLETVKFANKLLELARLWRKSQSSSKIKITEENDVSFFLRKLVPRQLDYYQSSHELVVVLKTCFIFIPLFSTDYYWNKEKCIYMFAYNWMLSTNIDFGSGLARTGATLSAHALVLGNNEIELSKSDVKDGNVRKDCFATKQWVLEKLTPTLCKWCNKECEEMDHNALLQIPSSLSLLNKEKYTVLYHHLKKKYGIEIAKIWPEVTDPQKYVYEDVAIATYLIILWEKERKVTGIERMQSFIDLGCGNGLLVHILISEGHPGKGIDVRRRKIWSFYGNKTLLTEATVNPDDVSMVNGYDWLLGNHSDELTPWIPVMATRCSYNMKYWVLPCCTFDFYARYEREHSEHSQYIDYLNFVKMVGEKCGFNVEVDVMRIPSTKRVCLIGMTRCNKLSDYCDVIKQANTFVQSRKTTKFANEGQIPLRPKQEEIHNCTKLERKIQDEIVRAISSYLLSFSNHIENPIGGTWNVGGKISLKDASKILSEDTKLHLKNEHGGLQTLLRNNNQIFEVMDGCVAIHNWTSIDLPRRSRNKQRNHLAANLRKTKPCWFYNNHPNGCPRVSDECPFSHESGLPQNGRSSSK